MRATEQFHVVLFVTLYKVNVANLCGLNDVWW